MIVLDDSAALKYTVDEMAKELVLLEKHAKGYPEESAGWCEECLLKHLLTIEGLADEGVLFTKSDVERDFFQRAGSAAKLAREVAGRSKDKASFLALAELARMVRKRLDEVFHSGKPCPICSLPLPSPLSMKEEKQIIEQLTSNPTSNMSSSPEPEIQDSKIIWVVPVMLIVGVFGAWVLGNLLVQQE